ncbi:hypothetical protein HDU91_004925 [Kappamyces sp. JEL0680]|nr:hypothetical protein HDU91_004925 [Kappamyces sp. JEL0680]
MTTKAGVPRLIHAGKYLVLFFYPLDFTFVCPTEIIAFNDKASEFQKLGCEVVGCSIDSKFSHYQWTQMPRKQGGLGPMTIPLLADGKKRAAHALVTKQIASDYGVLITEGPDAGLAARYVLRCLRYRGTFIIDPKQNLRVAQVNDLPIGRSVDEVLRLVEAVKFYEANGEVCPAGWKKGDLTMKDDVKLSKKYFEAAVLVYNLFLFLVNPKVRITVPSPGDRDDHSLPDVLEKEEAQDEVSEHLLPWPDLIKERLKRWLTPGNEDFPATELERPSVTLLGTASRNPSPAPPREEELFMSPTVESEWINLVLNRMFVTLRASKEFRRLYSTKMSNKMNLKLKGNSFVSQIDITDLRCGENAPSIDGIRLLKGLTEDFAVMGECDLTYRGGASISIQATIANGSVIPVKVYMNEFSGTLRIRLPSERWDDMIGYAFVQDPGVTFRVESSLTLADNQMLRGMVNGVLSSLMRKTFLELWVLPSWRTTFLPLLEPNLEDWVAREDEDAKMDQAKKAKHTIASRATQLWESSTAPLGGNIQSLLKKPLEKTRDCLEGQVFDVSCLVPRAAVERKLNFDDPLSIALLAFVDEPLEDSRPRSNSDRFKVADDDPSQPPSTAEDPLPPTVGWKAIRSKLDISIQKKRVPDAETGSVVEMTRATIPIQCDVARIFAILSNPVHFRHVYDSFIEAKVLFEGTTATFILDGPHLIHSCSFQLGKVERRFQVFQTKSADETDTRFVAMRSVGGLGEVDMESSTEDFEDEFDGKTDLAENDSEQALRHRKSRSFTAKVVESAAEPVSVSAGTSVPTSSGPPAQLAQKSSSAAQIEQEGTVYLFGYLIKKVTETSCLVTVVSQFSSELHRLDVDFSFGRKLKLFIEELTQLTDGNQLAGASDSGAKSLDTLKVRDKIANYLGTAALFLRKSKNRSSEAIGQTEEGRTLANSDPADLSLAPSNFDSEGRDSVTIPSSLEFGDGLHASQEELALVPYVERMLGPREIVRVELAFNRQMYANRVLFKWEYCCRSEQCPSFAIHYIPNDENRLSPSADLLPYGGSGTRILLPLSQIQCYSRPAWGSISLSELKSGKIVLVWENNQPISMRFPKTLTYKSIFQGETASYPEMHFQVAIPRKSFFSQPFLLDHFTESAGFNFNLEFSTGNVLVPFALYFDELPPATDEESPVAHSGVSDRLASAINHSDTYRRALPRRTIIPFDHPQARAGQTNHTIPLSGKPGVYTLVWDNSTSIVSTRQVVIHASLVKASESK